MVDERLCLGVGRDDDTGKTNDEQERESLEEWQAVWDVAKDATPEIRGPVQTIVNAKAAAIRRRPVTRAVIHRGAMCRGYHHH